MPFVVALVFALLQTLAFAPTPGSGEGLAVLGNGARQTTAATRFIGGLASSVPEEALPAARTLRTPPLPRPNGRTSFGDGATTAAVAAAHAPLPAFVRATSGRLDAAAARIVAARGSLLPYFPTAPPLQG